MEVTGLEYQTSALGDSCNSPAPQPPLLFGMSNSEDCRVNDDGRAVECRALEWHKVPFHP
ncbi:hypothetical protein AAFF_G00369640 [Aldrovandia affinis]|uniref:Uncharacterized protein n=1 Tax=Aldrovandia affinis TaxID=143900 RepID=A0AAD7VYJ4_9TELE|nr:hypothetical protein AAFF_G00369640 [Aldrovandia affinis]